MFGDFSTRILAKIKRREALPLRPDGCSQISDTKRGCKTVAYVRSNRRNGLHGDLLSIEVGYNDQVFDDSTHFKSCIYVTNRQEVNDDDEQMKKALSEMNKDLCLKMIEILLIFI